MIIIILCAYAAAASRREKENKSVLDRSNLINGETCFAILIINSMYDEFVLDFDMNS